MHSCISACFGSSEIRALRSAGPLSRRHPSVRLPLGCGFSSGVSRLARGLIGGMSTTGCCCLTRFSHSIGDFAIFSPTPLVILSSFLLHTHPSNARYDRCREHEQLVRQAFPSWDVPACVLRSMNLSDHIICVSW